MPRADDAATVRAKTRGMFASVMSEDPIWPQLTPGDKERYPTVFEKICLNEAIGATPAGGLASFDSAVFLQGYSAVGYRLASALLRTARFGGASLLARCVSAELKLSAVGAAPMAELDPEAGRALRAVIELRTQQRAEPVVSTLYKCHKCKVNRTRSVTYQARSSDEGDTCLVTCLNCGEHWYI